jgi:hypothetical protein
MSEQIAAGSAVYGMDGLVASVRSVALSPISLEATWLLLTVKETEHVTAVPTSAASVDGTGVVHVPFTRDQLLSAPAVDETVDEQQGLQLRHALGLT